MATAGTTSVKCMIVALRPGVTQATLPNGISMRSGVNYAISLEDYARITNAARETIITSTPETKEYVVPLWNGANYTLDLTTINDYSTLDLLNADAQAQKDFKLGDVVQGFNGDFFKLVLADAQNDQTIAQGDTVVWGGNVETINDSVVTSDYGDISSPVFAGVAIAGITDGQYGWIQVAGEAISVAVETNVVAGDALLLSENTEEKLTSATNEVVDVVLANGDGVENFKLTFGAQTTADILWDATGAQVQAALELLSTIGSGNVTVTRSGNTPDFTHRITFVGDLAATNVGAVTHTAGTAPGNLTVTPSVITTGSGGLGEVIGTATSYDTGRADVAIRSSNSTNNHFKTRDLFVWK